MEAMGLCTLFYLWGLCDFAPLGPLSPIDIFPTALLLRSGNYIIVPFARDAVEKVPFSYSGRSAYMAELTVYRALFIGWIVDKLHYQLNSICVWRSWKHVCRQCGIIVVLY
ncbi:hypothetical protein F4808DRAFT_422181 [Astrocystis sublimbata]|nr:hypothetical protein F4808DRAFT_422181 [Astrocystis sublimbata]